MVAKQIMSVAVHTNINGRSIDFMTEPGRSLLDVLRDQLGLTGTKQGCNNGNCGACSVLMDGILVNSCLVLAVEAEGKAITTIEGIGSPDHLHPLQETFLKNNAMQCGICTPGFIMASIALLDQNPDPSEAQVRHWLAGNLCRCTGYDPIVRSVLEAAAILRTSKQQLSDEKRKTGGIDER